jgi:uncharacterized iron-regulated membrane protein
MRALFVMLMLMLAGCASSGGAGKEVAAVVQSEDARQAAVDTAQQGAGSEAALKAGAEAVPKAAADKTDDPPTY